MSGKCKSNSDFTGNIVSGTHIQAWGKPTNSYSSCRETSYYSSGGTSTPSYISSCVPTFGSSGGSGLYGELSVGQGGIMYYRS
jgi:hypothetical protein